MRGWGCNVCTARQQQITTYPQRLGVTLEPEIIIMRPGHDNRIDIANRMLSRLCFAGQEVKASPPCRDIARFTSVTPGTGSPPGLSDDVS